MTRLAVVSGLSGSGKSVALNMLEDLGWYCIDNIPAGLVHALVSHSLRSEEPMYRRLAVGLDARNRPADLASIPSLISDLRRSGLRCDVLYLHAEDDVILRRYGETRRRHPLAREGVGLADAVDRDDVGVVQPCGGLCLTAKPLELSWSTERVRREDLDRDVPAQRDLFGLVDDTHSPTADLA